MLISDSYTVSAKEKTKTLGLFMATRGWLRYFGKCIFCTTIIVSPLNGIASEIDVNYPITSQFSSVYAFAEYINSLDPQNIDLDELAKVIVNFRHCILESGQECPNLCEIAIDLRDLFEENDVFMTDDEFEDLIHLFEKKESEFQFISSGYALHQRPQVILAKHKHKHKKKKKHKELKMSPKGVFAFCKCLAGALLMIIPSGVSQAIGVALIANGISDATEDLIRQNGENSGILNNRPAEYEREIFDQIGR